METWAFFIFGVPGEDENTVRETIKFAKKINPDVVKFHILKPYPGTKIFDELEESGLILDNDFDKYGIHMPPVHRLPNMETEALLNLQRAAYRSFYLRPVLIAKHIKRAKTFHRFMENLNLGLMVLKGSKQEKSKSTVVNK